MHLGERYYTEDELAGAGFRSVGRNVKIKRSAGLFFTENISIDDDSRIDDFTIIVASREPVAIGRHVHIASQCYIAASDGFVMEDFAGLAPGVLIFTSSDDYTGKKLTNPTLPRHLTGGPAGPIRLGATSSSAPARSSCRASKSGPAPRWARCRWSENHWPNGASTPVRRSDTFVRGARICSSSRRSCWRAARRNKPRLGPQSPGCILVRAI